jgi:hypothetical protein
MVMRTMSGLIDEKNNLTCIILQFSQITTHTPIQHIPKIYVFYELQPWGQRD